MTFIRESGIDTGGVSREFYPGKLLSVSEKGFRSEVMPYVQGKLINGCSQ